MSAYNGDTQNDSGSDDELGGFLQRWKGRGKSRHWDQKHDNKRFKLENAGQTPNENSTQSIDQITIFRPFASHTHISFDTEARSKTAFREMNWYYHILDRYLEAGYSSAALVSTFRGIPFELANVLKESLHAIQILRSSQLKKAAASLPAVEVYTPDLVSAQTTAGYMSDECGFICLHWHPETQVCSSQHIYVS
jgi:hypothetical protein